jgi:anaerobic ribonucleoside-triphosphate reductase activating protein
MQIRLAADLQKDSIVDGNGIRTVIWTQGCPHNCFGCHNPSTHSFDDGALIDVEDIKVEIDNLVYQDGITFSGGDPMCQSAACYEIAKYARKLGLNIWCYTGYTFEELIKLGKYKKSIMDFLSCIDVLVDGKFMMEFKSLDCLYRGSTNQRLIDVKKSLSNGAVCLLEEKTGITPFKKNNHIYV